MMRGIFIQGKKWLYVARTVALMSTAAVVLLFCVTGAGADDLKKPGGIPISSYETGEIAVGCSPDSSNGLVAWQGRRSGSSTYGLYAQQVDRSGDLLWEGGLILAEPSGNVQAPTIICNADGSAVAVWQDDRTGKSKVYAQKAGPTGGTRWSKNGVPVSGSDTQMTAPSLVSDGQGGAVVVWQTFGTENDLYVQRLDSKGARSWGDNGKKVSTAACDYRGEASLVYDGNGGAVVVWHDKSGSASDVYAQRFDPSGNRLWGDGGKPISTAARCQTAPTVVMTPNGDFVTVWQDCRDSTHTQIYAQRNDTSGNPLWQPNGSKIADSPGLNFDDPKPVRVQSNGWAASNDVTVFLKGSETGDPTRQGIYGQRVDPNGQPALQTPADVVTKAKRDIEEIGASPDKSGGSFVSWGDKHGGYPFVYYQRFDSGLMSYYAEPQSVATGSDAQDGSAISSGGKNSALVAWVDYRGGSLEGHPYCNWIGDLFPNTYYFAEGTTRPGFAPFIPIMNKSMTDDVAVTCNFLKGDGSTEEHKTNVPANSRGTVNVKDVLGSADDAAHDFSVELESSGPVLAERSMYSNYKGAVPGGTDVLGARDPGPTFYFAEGTTRPGFTSYIAVMNTSSTDSADVTCNFYRGEDGSGRRGNGSESHNIEVPPDTRATVCVNDVIGSGDSPAYDFSTVVECANGVPILAERPMYFSYKGQWEGSSDVVGVQSLGADFYFAEGTTRPGFDSYFCLVNSSGSDAQVKISLYRGEGDAKTHDVTVPAESRQTVCVNEVLGSGESPAYDFSARVRSTNGVPILAERPMYFNYSGQWDGGTDVIGSSSLDTTFFFAEGTTRPDFVTYYSIANVSATETAQVEIVFNPGEGESRTTTLSVPPQSRATVDASTVMGVGEDPSHDFAATVLSTNGVPILVERPMYFNYGGQWPGGTDVIGSTP